MQKHNAHVIEYKREEMRKALRQCAMKMKTFEVWAKLVLH